MPPVGHLHYWIGRRVHLHVRRVHSAALHERRPTRVRATGAYNKGRCLQALAERDKALLESGADAELPDELMSLTL